MFITLSLYSCFQRGNGNTYDYSYYKNNDSLYSKFEYFASDTTKCNYEDYYNDGSVMSTSTFIKKENGEWVCYKNCKCFYIDGFPKESYMCDSLGRALCPRETGVMDGYKIIVDIDTNIYTQDSFIFHPMRIYVENIPINHYWIGIRDRKTNSYLEIPKLEKIIKKYTISYPPYAENDTYIKEIDESLYYYAITESHEEYCVIDSMGTRGYVFGIYFADTTGYVGTSPKLTTFIPFDFYRFN